MTFAVCVVIDVSARVSVSVREDESTDMDMGVGAPVVYAVAFVLGFDLAVLVATLHMTVALALVSLGREDECASFIMWGTYLKQTSIFFHLIIYGCDKVFTSRIVACDIQRRWTKQ